VGVPVGSGVSVGDFVGGYVGWRSTITVGVGLESPQLVMMTREMATRTITAMVFFNTTPPAPNKPTQITCVTTPFRTWPDRFITLQPHPYSCIKRSAAIGVDWQKISPFQQYSKPRRRKNSDFRHYFAYIWCDSMMKQPKTMLYTSRCDASYS
jgi:hypothetical protein